jgi:hypothetical protein
MITPSRRYDFHVEPSTIFGTQMERHIGKCLDIPYGFIFSLVHIQKNCCKSQNFITIKDRQKVQGIIMKSMDYSRGYKTPNHLTLESSQKKGLVNQIIDHESIRLKISELLVVEYYSRQA